MRDFEVTMRVSCVVTADNVREAKELARGQVAFGIDDLLELEVRDIEDYEEVEYDR